MAQIVLQFYVENQNILADNGNLPIIGNSQNLYIAAFQFGPVWDGLTKYAQFTYQKDTSQTTVNMAVTDNSCDIPNELYTQSRTFSLSVYGVDLDNHTRITTGAFQLSVFTSAFRTTGTTPLEPPEIGDLYVRSGHKTTAETSIKSIHYVGRGEEDGLFYYYDTSTDKFVPVLDAYQSALQGGYAGTEENFYTDLGLFSQYVDECAAAANSSNGSMMTAKLSAAAAQEAKTEAQAAQEAAQTAQTSAQVSAQTAQESAATASQKAVEAQLAQGQAAYSAMQAQQAKEDAVYAAENIQVEDLSDEELAAIMI